MKKKIVALAGASGLIGTNLTNYLKEFEIWKISRQDFLEGEHEFAEKFWKADVIINLSGAPVLRRWTKKYRKEILESRVRTTRKLKCITEFYPDHKRLILSASAIGIYNDEDVHTEESISWGEGYLADVVKQWESEAKNLASANTMVCIMRMGVVLAGSGGMTAKLMPFFRFGLGGRIGAGNQFMSWIHIEDLCRAVVFIINRNKDGIYNLTAPVYTTNKEFTRLLGRAIHKPALFIIPGIVLRLMYGQGASVVTGGQAVLPTRLIREGFNFHYVNINKALIDIVN